MLIQHSAGQSSVTHLAPSELAERLLALAPADRDLGQHYLVEEGVLRRSLDLAAEVIGPLAGRSVLEIGPGPGVLTQALLTAGAHVTAIELAEPAQCHIGWTFSEAIDDGTLSLVAGDALDVPWPDTLDAIISNPPYGITSPLLERIEQHLRTHGAAGPQVVVLLLQDEVVTRMDLEVSPRDRSSLGLSLALEWLVEPADAVPTSAFRPHPKVASRLVRLTPHAGFDVASQDLEAPPDRRLVRMIIQQGYADRRRTLRNALSRPPRRLARLPGWHRDRWTAALTALADEPLLASRAEQLSLPEWVWLAHVLTTSSSD